LVGTAPYGQTVGSLLRTPWLSNLVIKIAKIMYQRYTMEQHAFKNVNSCLNTNIYSYLETAGAQSSNLNLNVVHFFTPVFIRHL
jgi:hypothetical protein